MAQKLRAGIILAKNLNSVPAPSQVTQLWGSQHPLLNSVGICTDMQIDIHVTYTLN